jgi:deoxyribodipyrimidine photo-lyase
MLCARGYDMSDPAIVWFRQDLRINDNPALSTALQHHERVIPLFIHTSGNSNEWRHGAASRWWLHHSLKSLNQSLRELGSRLIIRTGDNSLSVIRQLIAESKASHIYWNRLYEPFHIERDSTIKQALKDDGIAVNSFNGALLHEPWDIEKNDGGPFRVFTPFWKACVRSGLMGSQHAAPEHLPAVSSRIKSAKLDALELLPKIRWDRSFADHWQPGEDGAQLCLEEFLDHAVQNYQDDRNRPDIIGTSLLSAHLHFGEISPQQIVEKTTDAASFNRQPGVVAGTETFVREIGWREFAYHLLYHFPHTVDRPLHERFEHFPWDKNYERNLRAWQQGQTGIPLVDAGMRQLWQTGWMHNRVRCGADAAPYFRIFNPVTQAEKFDPMGIYIRQWIPEISALPGKYLFQPWAASAALLDEHGIRLGKDYPRPVVDLKASRQRALERYQAIKKPSPDSR